MSRRLRASDDDNRRPPEIIEVGQLELDYERGIPALRRDDGSVLLLYSGLLLQMEIDALMGQRVNVTGKRIHANEFRVIDVMEADGDRQPH